MAMRLVRIMRSRIDWQALPFLAWHYGFTDEFDDVVELLPIVCERLARNPDDPETED